MSKKLHEERKAYWEPIINDWKSKKISAIKYCKNNNLSISCFYKWKLFFNKPKITKDSFVELSKNINPEIEIESKKYIFKFKNVDVNFVGNFLKILKDF